jgi:hypothetical protein
MSLLRAVCPTNAFIVGAVGGTGKQNQRTLTRVHQRSRQRHGAIVVVPWTLLRKNFLGDVDPSSTDNLRLFLFKHRVSEGAVIDVRDPSGRISGTESK